jgi:NADPH:quinone reductase
MIQARAVMVVTPGEVNGIELKNIEIRDPGYGEIRVLVAAAGLNRADVMQRKGLYPAPQGTRADILGLEYAGTIERIGEGVSGFSVGDAVMGIVAGGAMCTHVVVHHREAMRVPPGMTLHEAAAVPEVFVTAWDALYKQAALQPGERCLIHAVTSGVGTAATQLCAVLGATSFGTSRSPEKLVRSMSYGLHHGVIPKEKNFSDNLLALTEGKGVHVVLDAVGVDYFHETLRCMAPLGRLVLIGLMGGAHGELSLAPIVTKRLSIMGSTLRARPLEDKCLIAQEFERTILPLFTRGLLRPVVDAVLPMSNIRDAHTKMERNETFGKLVLTW